MIIKFREPVAHRDPTGKTHPSVVGKTETKTSESNGDTNRISRGWQILGAKVRCKCKVCECDACKCKVCGCDVGGVGLLGGDRLLLACGWVSGVRPDVCPVCAAAPPSETLYRSSGHPIP